MAVRESWLRRKAAARAIPCTFLGKHLRFSPGRSGRARCGRRAATPHGVPSCAQPTPNPLTPTQGRSR
jgi:hypothetical protein